jgi:hypothetical protein
MGLFSSGANYIHFSKDANIKFKLLCKSFVTFFYDSIIFTLIIAKEAIK